ncbi:MAG: NAD(P)H-hydrate dehydratase [Planctomycetota bacterium]|nr:NAD(P)H-hydrate dehydratase [Planctomycetota bacterium]
MPFHSANSSKPRAKRAGAANSRAVGLRRVLRPAAIPLRPVGGQKGLFGRVLIVGGSEDMIGAPVLAGAAALRCGSGLVQIAMPRDVLVAALSVVPELIGLGLKDGDEKKLLEAADKADVLAIGPGMGESKLAGTRIKALTGLDKLMVVDADALNYISSLGSWPKWFKARAVLTPHPGEMKRLGKLIRRSEVPADDKGRIELAVSAAKAFGQVVLLKGERTVVTDGHRVYVNHSGDSSLSKAGAGDVLSGIIASLMGQGMERFEAACAGAFMHGKAGEYAGKQLGRRSVLAREVIEAIPQVIGR